MKGSASVGSLRSTVVSLECRMCREILASEALGCSGIQRRRAATVSRDVRVRGYEERGGYVLRKTFGFTLIELLIVVAIIAILAAIAVPNFMHAQTRAKIARSLADMRNMGTSVESFRADWSLDLLDNWDDDDAAEVAKYSSLAALRHTTGMADNARTMNIVMNLLSTPVAYLARIPEDPFLIYDSAQEAAMAGHSAGVQAVVSILAGKYWYGDQDGHRGGLTRDHNIIALQPGTAQANGLRALENNEWILLGVGPDNKPEEISFAALRGIPYDPSNGLISQGDLTVRSTGTMQ